MAFSSSAERPNSENSFVVISWSASIRPYQYISVGKSCTIENGGSDWFGRNRVVLVGFTTPSTPGVSALATTRRFCLPRSRAGEQPLHAPRPWQPLREPFRGSLGELPPFRNTS